MIGAELALSLLLAGLAQRDEPQWMREPFKTRAGDDPSWADPAFDDREWPELDAGLRPGTTVPGWAGIAWFRRWIEVPAEMSGHPVPLYGRYVGAAEVFIDGTRVFSVGDPEEVASTQTTPVSFRVDSPPWVLFSRPGRHLIAVRFASAAVAAMHAVEFPAGFELALGPMKLERSEEWFGWLTRAGFIGATAALALLHLLLFVFHRHRRENLHYALAAFGIAALIGSQEMLRWAETTRDVQISLGGFGAAIALSSVLLLRFYYAVFSRRLPKSYWPLFAIALVLAATAWALPKAIYYIFAVLVCLEQARVLAGAVIRRADGAWIIGIGGALWLGGAVIQMFGDMGLIPFPPNIYLYGFLALLGSISVYLARDIARDRTDLARAMERYRTIFETTGTGTIMFGDDAVISLANEEWAELTGYSRAEIEQRMAWREFFDDQSRDAGTRKARLRDRRGKIRDGVVTISLVPGTRERVGSFLDLTDLERAQRQIIRADKMAALGQIAAGVAHEINNPNNFIHFNLPILRRYVDAMRPLLEDRMEQDRELKLLNMRGDVFLEDLSKMITNMEHGSQRITSIVSNLRSYIRSGEDSEMKLGAIPKVIEQVMALAGTQVRKMVKELEVSVADDLPQVKMNAGKIEQVLINLLINAGQAADKEASWVKLRARAVDDKSAVEIAIEDNGSGIPAEHLEQIFEPFFTTKGRETGTGLGLSISQQIVEEHHGRIEVTSEVGKGSCFTVRLPAAGP